MQIANLFFHPGSESIPGFKPGARAPWLCRRYDEEHPFTVQGTVLEFEFINPHSAIIFEAKDQSGAMQRWHAELGGANALHRADGWTKDTLKPGDKITIIGPRNKNGANDMNLSTKARSL